MLHAIGYGQEPDVHYSLGPRSILKKLLVVLTLLE